jgi:hypothetical protein
VKDVKRSVEVIQRRVKDKVRRGRRKEKEQSGLKYDESQSVRLQGALQATVELCRNWATHLPRALHVSGIASCHLTCDRKCELQWTPFRHNQSGRAIICRFLSLGSIFLKWDR